MSIMWHLEESDIYWDWYTHQNKLELFEIENLKPTSVALNWPWVQLTTNFACTYEQLVQRDVM